jgi:hypothetical protein
MAITVADTKLLQYMLDIKYSQNNQIELVLTRFSKTVFAEWSTYINTVKLGYNELGYNAHSVITNIFFSPKWSVYYINQPGYNEPRL